jgi:3D (Asp-Asp-Asp) domain-containing protein
MSKNISIIAILLIITALGLSRIQYNEAVTQIYEANKRAELLKLDIHQVQDQLDAANNMIQDLKSDEYEFIYVGEYTLTHYCVGKYPHICGTGSGKTATGTEVTAGRSVAVDPKVIPYGTQMYIEGYGFRTAEDCGGAVKNKQIDIAVETHDMANALGRKKGGVWLLIKK